MDKVHTSKFKTRMFWMVTTLCATRLLYVHKHCHLLEDLGNTIYFVLNLHSNLLKSLGSLIVVLLCKSNKNPEPPT